jgi:hypothetical protein
MNGKYEAKALIDIFIGVQKFTGTDGKEKTKNVYGRISKAAAAAIGLPTALNKTGAGNLVIINKGKAKGATYKRPIRGSRGDTYILNYAASGTGNQTQAANQKKAVRIGVPAGTNGTTFDAFVKKLTKKPLSITYPSGKTHRLSDFGAVSR